MPTTTIRLDDELKTRLAECAQRAGKTAHAFILDAIAQTVDQSEQDDAFQALADQRWANIQASGNTVAWEAAKDYLTARARGEQARQPVARQPAKQPDK